MRRSMVLKWIGLGFATALAVTGAMAWAQNANSTGGYCPHRMGSGMMGGYGMGPGMMGSGMGPGMMGSGPFENLDLSDDQRSKLNHISDAERKQHWDIMGQMMEAQNKLRDLYAVEEPDPKKVGEVYGTIGQLQQQMIETHVQANNEMLEVLTKEQREQLQQEHHGAWGPGKGPHEPAADQGNAIGPGMMGQ
ncbi:MAG: Spy/CpxP family protein refolding chaperone [Sulfuricaulis sp.]